MVKKKEEMRKNTFFLSFFLSFWGFFGTASSNCLNQARLFEELIWNLGTQEGWNIHMSADEDANEQ